MNKSILMSVRPEHVLNILNGTKTLELRKTVPKDYVGWVYIYCTKGDRELRGVNSIIYHKNFTPEVKVVINREKINYSSYSSKALNGKVVARFWFDDYDTYHHDNHGVDLYTDVAEYNVMYDDLEKLCLDYREIEHYGENKELYAWHIKQIEMFDEPLMLSDFYKTKISYIGISEIEYALDYYGKEKVDNILKYSLKRAPQSWQYVYIKARQ